MNESSSSAETKEGEGIRTRWGRRPPSRSGVGPCWVRAASRTGGCQWAPLRVLWGRMPFMGEDAEAEITGDEELPQGPFGSISFANLDETDFEEFCYDLLFQLGFVNVDWRKGTPKKASPSDRGRDIVAQLEHVDVEVTGTLRPGSSTASTTSEVYPPRRCRALRPGQRPNGLEQHW
jgi:hypothetical protein